jgi:hypothetical protein
MQIFFGESITNRRQALHPCYEAVCFGITASLINITQRYFYFFQRLPGGVHRDGMEGKRFFLVHFLPTNFYMAY